MHIEQARIEVLSRDNVAAAELPKALPNPAELNEWVCLFRLLGQTATLRLLLAVRQLEVASVSELANHLGVDLKTISRDLDGLVEFGLLGAYRSEEGTYHSLSSGRLRDLLSRILGSD